MSGIFKCTTAKSPNGDSGEAECGDSIRKYRLFSLVKAVRGCKLLKRQIPAPAAGPVKTGKELPMAEVTIKSSAACEIIDITSLVASGIPVGMKNGVCIVYSPHSTAGVTVNENYDPAVKHDLLSRLDVMAPQNDPQYQHAEGNSAAHIKTSLVGVSQTVPVRNGKLALGQWQGIYFCEFDGPRTRRVKLVFLNSIE